MYLFLAERLHLIHTVRKRRQDYLHIFNVTTILVGFGVIAILTFIFPVAAIGDNDGLCRIGIRRGVTIPLLVFDLSINIWLTCCFVSFVRPFMDKLPWAKSSPQQDTPDKPQFRNAQSSNEIADAIFAKLARNSLLGCLLVLSTTVANLTLVLVYHGHEQGWVCFLACSIDSRYQFSNPADSQLHGAFVLSTG